MKDLEDAWAYMGRRMLMESVCLFKDKWYVYIVNNQRYVGKGTYANIHTFKYVMDDGTLGKEEYTTLPEDLKVVKGASSQIVVTLPEEQ